MKKRFIAAAAVLSVISSCASYNPNVNLPSEIKKIAVPVYINKTEKYGLEQYITQKTIDEFLADGKISIIDDERKADGIIKCRITKYINSAIKYDENSQVPQQYRLRIYLDIYFFDNINQRLLWKEENIYEEQTYYVANDLGMPVEDETIGSQKVMDALAKRVVRRVVYGW